MQWWVFHLVKGSPAHTMGLPLAARGIIFIVAHSETNSLPVMMMVIFEGGLYSVTELKLMSCPILWLLSGVGWMAWPVPVIADCPEYILHLFTQHRQIKQPNRQRETLETGNVGMEGVWIRVIIRWRAQKQMREVRTDRLKCQDSRRMMTWRAKIVDHWYLVACQISSSIWKLTDIRQLPLNEVFLKESH